MFPFCSCRIRFTSSSSGAATGGPHFMVLLVFLKSLTFNGVRLTISACSTNVKTKVAELLELASKIDQPVDDFKS